uniref:glutamate racemase n=1 Tax=Halomonas sp. TaxID=1486246 RepID=UPI00260EA49D|nr:glutamate racemase [Halomonas sp.]
MTGPVLVFDSGVGGLSVVAALRQRIPGGALAYCCDNAMLPYGIREDAWLVERILAVCSAAVEASGAGTLVVACNTASTLALDALRGHLRIPVVGTVPAIKPAARESRSGHLALLATSATVARSYTQRLIDDFAPGCQVMRIAADPLVTQAERWILGCSPDQDVLCQALSPLQQDRQIDTIVLGCTHFPLLRDLLAKAAEEHLGREFAWIDSGDAIARRTAQVAGTPELSDAPGLVLVTALEPERTLAMAQGFASFGFNSPTLLSVPRA